MSKCRTPVVIEACFTPDDLTLPPVSVAHVTVFKPDGTPRAAYYMDDAGAAINPTSYLGGGEVSLGACITRVAHEVYVVRLDGDTALPAVASIEGASGAVVGNSFEIGAGSDFPEYVSYDVVWLGDTQQDAALLWNDTEYRAGGGSGSAGYTHSSLPGLSESAGYYHDSAVKFTAGAGAHVEIRFKVKA